MIHDKAINCKTPLYLKDKEEFRYVSAYLTIPGQSLVPFRYCLR
jgi:hypothetical protein